MADTSGATANTFNYPDLQAAVSDLVESHVLPMAMFDRGLNLLGLNRNFISFLPDSHGLEAGDPIEDLLFALGEESDGPVVMSGDMALETGGRSSSAIANALREGDWRLNPIVTHDGRVVVPFNYPLASGNTQLVLLEPSRMGEVTDLGEVLDVAADAFAIFDDDQRLIQCNSQFVALLTYDPTSPPPLGQTAREIVRGVVETGTLLVGAGMDKAQMTEAMVAGLLTPAGATFEIEGKLGRIFLASTKPRSSGGHILTLRDITDIRKSERQAITTLRAAVDALEQGFAFYDETLTLQVWNEQYDRMYCGDCGLHPRKGEDGVEFLRKVMETGRFLLEPGVDIDQAIAGILRKIENGERVEYNFSDGTTVLCSYNRTASNGLLVTLLDITDKRDSEQRALATLRDASGALEEGFSLWDKDFNFVLCNERYCELVFKDPDFRPESGQPGLEISAIAAANATMSLPEGLTAEEFAQRSYVQLRNLAKNVEIRLDTGRIVEFSGHRTAQGGYLITVLDVTERHRAAEELERQAQIAHQNEKLSALGELLAGVAHELNNPLSIVVGYSQLLSAELTDPRQQDRIRRVTQAAERSAKIIKTFLAMARQRPAKMEPVDLADVIETAVDVAAYGLRTTGGHLAVGCAPDLPLVQADKDQMVQVFSNLIVNAEHAMKGMGQEARLAIRATHANGRVEVAIRDNGIGMDDETRNRIFEPFFTTKDVGSGTGFGLAFCHRIVTSHAGTLDVRSKPGQGSEFVIGLPTLDDVEAAEALEGVKADGRLRVLVVDDEADVADLIAEVLMARGHEVFCAYSPNAAIEAAAREPFAIVLSDMKMPEMTGDLLQRELLAQRPELAGRIGFITGDSLSARVRDFLEDGKQHFIEKPVVIEELLDLVERIRPRPWGRSAGI
ncbi:PAS-domain containing protein [Novosphingobium mangrovi (ex Huang et al. 2023)]|uniref:histidine kinase n=1 Tax=Novosphingobium mangrovi (ex Huang et al. 2023) TaxID=2976432 RepID=A0ABT2I8K9_9SPHN|nr:PAS-domain containing protein [Novosphingobium mangrovi (ex Huang et al. 2023)]MCT2401176.1 PAS-domain containing protein [Novosphingobium mangrovi (ex Huang et al. 2023)]